MINMKDEYKQKIANINYLDKTVNISLTRQQWNSVDTWVQLNKSGRDSDEWFDDLYCMFLIPISNEINFSNKDYNYVDDFTFQIPRKLLQIFVYSIGRIAYSLDVKGLTAVCARTILNKVNKQIKEQLSVDDTWFKSGY